MYHTFKNIAKKKLLTIPFFNEFGTIFVERERERERENQRVRCFVVVQHDYVSCICADKTGQTSRVSEYKFTNSNCLPMIYITKNS
ncbi:MAG: hypothetical protein LBG92_07745 [Prevotellaceae bacterium]|jgi:hypothetical protein|nr:hypothetical protein [Prevotellaceae bacterium]